MTAAKNVDDSTIVRHQCCNCGKHFSLGNPSFELSSTSGDSYCSVECQQQVESLGLPSAGFRNIDETRRLMDAENALRSLASWLGTGGYNQASVDAKAFEDKIRWGVQHLLEVEQRIRYNKDETQSSVAKEPTLGCLMSMAIRFDHALGMPHFYDHVPRFPGDSHRRRLDGTLSQMRQLYEEVALQGFYAVDRDKAYEEMYHLAMAAPKPSLDAGGYSEKHAQTTNAAQAMDLLHERVRDADRRAGEAIREMESFQADAQRHALWLMEAKRQWGVPLTASFDTVWQEALRLRKELQSDPIPSLNTKDRSQIVTLAQRVAIMDEFGIYRGHDLPGVVNKEELFSVPVLSSEGETVDAYLGFQWNDGGIVGIVPFVVTAMQGNRAGWSLAHWFVTPNFCLEGHRPVDILVSNSTAVLHAAMADGESKSNI